MKGFTLVEMLVAVAIFALLAAAGVGLMAYAADNRGALRTHMDRIGELQRTHALLRNDLSQAAVRRVRAPDGRPARRALEAGAEDGGRTLLAFARRGHANPDHEARASVEYVSYHLDGDRLERRTRRALDGAAADRGQVLIAGVRSARVHFHVHGRWNDGWPGGIQDLPDAIRLDLELEDLGTVSQSFLVAGTAP
ncbi:type II secretion system minor pseudopilin GspJ [Coralloluteibacterium thermophilus]|uniref:Type II secretion system protein J n=1 Tax=Coralloluteibacterium thermophilum TaxID=2707049 RepID=A0ABV9NL45_9GAMM